MPKNPRLLPFPNHFEIQAVTNRHRSDCTVCGDRPRCRRLITKEGGGRYQKQSVYCIVCGVRKLESLEDLLPRVRYVLQRGEGSIR